MMSSSIPGAFAFVGFSANTPLLLVLAISIVIGLLMVIVFRYTSDQKAIGRAKDRLKAHLLAVRLFQDQLPVVMRAYGKILRGTGSYLRLAFTPFLIAILPITFLIIQLDRYFGWMPLQAAQTFLVEARVEDPAALNDTSLQLPPELSSSAPAVHIPREPGHVARAGRARWAIRYPYRRRRPDRFEAGCGGAGAGSYFAGALAQGTSGSACSLRASRHWRIIVRCDRSQ